MGSTAIPALRLLLMPLRQHPLHPQLPIHRPPTPVVSAAIGALTTPTTPLSKPSFAVRWYHVVGISFGVAVLVAGVALLIFGGFFVSVSPLVIGFSILMETGLSIYEYQQEREEQARLRSQLPLIEHDLRLLGELKERIEALWARRDLLPHTKGKQIHSLCLIFFTKNKIKFIKKDKTASYGISLVPLWNQFRALMQSLSTLQNNFRASLRGEAPTETHAETEKKLIAAVEGNIKELASLIHQLETLKGKAVCTP